MALDLAVMLDTLSKSSVEISREERRLAITAATGVAEMRDHLGKDTKATLRPHYEFKRPQRPLQRHVD